MKFSNRRILVLACAGSLLASCGQSDEPSGTDGAVTSTPSSEPSGTGQAPAVQTPAVTASTTQMPPAVTTSSPAALPTPDEPIGTGSASASMPMPTGSGGAAGLDDEGAAGGGGAPSENGAGGTLGEDGAAGSSGSFGVGGDGAVGDGGSGAGTESPQESPMESSDGCGTETNQQGGSWVESMVMTEGGSRPYSVWLPEDYDPMRAYPVIGLLHGCGSGTNNVPMERQTGSDAILFRGTGSASGTCWESGANSADVAFVDAMLVDVQARFCADSSRMFVVGYSSGSWLADQLACIRADVLRGVATVAGGNPGVRDCAGPIAQIFVHDTEDMSNGIESSESARDRLLMENNCDTSIEPVPEDPEPCVRYQGCDEGYPVVWCQTTGEGHDRQDSLAAPAFWNFFQEF